jgi:hypothetical protein
MWQPFTNHRQSWIESLLLRKRAPDIIHSTPADRSACPYTVSLWANQWSTGQSQTSIDSMLLGLPGPYHRHAIDTFNACSRGPTHWSLTNTGGSYNLGGASFHITPRPSQLVVPTFHLRALSDLRLINPIIPIELKREINHNLVSETSPPDFYRSLSSKHSNY